MFKFFNARETIRYDPSGLGCPLKPGWSAARISSTYWHTGLLAITVNLAYRVLLEFSLTREDLIYRYGYVITPTLGHVLQLLIMSKVQKTIIAEMPPGSTKYFSTDIATYIITNIYKIWNIKTHLLSRELLPAKRRCLNDGCGGGDCDGDADDVYDDDDDNHNDDNEDECCFKGGG